VEQENEEVKQKSEHLFDKLDFINMITLQAEALESIIMRQKSSER
jgi:hypothetical protein